jgi:single stranded DNA-binding protein
MRGINKVILVGNSGKETEFKTLKDGTPVAKLSIATTETYRLKNGETFTSTEWHPVITLKLSENTLHSRINAMKFYYEQVLGREKF